MNQKIQKSFTRLIQMLFSFSCTLEDFPVVQGKEERKYHYELFRG
jgi:hypothetical protein